MNRPLESPQSTADLEFTETAFNAPPSSVAFKNAEGRANTPLQIDWDDYDTGTLDE